MKITQHPAKEPPAGSCIIEPTRQVRNVLLDSTRWNQIRFRDDDIVIATWSKSGTTWTQQIVSQLIFHCDPTIYGPTRSPWIDARGFPFAVALAETQTHRRFMKTHLPADALRMSRKARYILVGRDARDVFWSWHNHYMSLSDKAYDALNSSPYRTGPPLCRPNRDIRADYFHWLAEDDAACGPFWPHVRSWWEIRHWPTVMFLHYCELKDDLPKAIHRIADFLEIDLDHTELPKILDHCSMGHMRKLANQWMMMNLGFDGGGEAFINKGTNGRWRSVLSDDDIALCDAVAAAKLTPECAHWLATGEFIP